MREKMRWLSRGLWTLSLLGMILAWKQRQARYLWLVPVGCLVAVHLPTVCHSRYMFPVLPLLMPYSGVTLVWVWQKTVGRIFHMVRKR
jgi:hypothetical protein